MPPVPEPPDMPDHDDPTDVPLAGHVPSPGDEGADRFLQADTEEAAPGDDEAPAAGAPADAADGDAEVGDVEVGDADSATDAAAAAPAATGGSATKPGKKGGAGKGIALVVLLLGGGLFALLGLAVLGGAAAWFLLYRGADDTEVDVASAPAAVEAPEVPEDPLARAREILDATPAGSDEAAGGEALDEAAAGDAATEDAAAGDEDAAGDAATDEAARTGAGAGEDEKPGDDEAAPSEPVASRDTPEAAPATASKKAAPARPASHVPAPARKPAVATHTPTAAAPVVVKLLSQPANARIVVDGAERGYTNSKVELTPGRHEVVMSAGGDEGRFTIEVGAGGLNKWCYRFDEARSIHGSCR